MNPEIANLNRANAIWHDATDALLARDYERFDRLMHEFRSTTRHWTPKRTDAGTETAPGE